MFGAYSDYPEDNDVLIRLYTEKGEEMIRYKAFEKNRITDTVNALNSTGYNG